MNKILRNITNKVPASAPAHVKPSIIKLPLARRPESAADSTSPSPLKTTATTNR